jgi:hypothetical protein
MHGATMKVTGQLVHILSHTSKTHKINDTLPAG